MSELRDATESAVLEGVASVMVPGYAERRNRARNRSSGRSGSMARQLGADLPEAAARGWVTTSPSPDGPLAIGYVNGVQ